jgi:hypothetical protein
LALTAGCGEQSPDAKTGSPASGGAGSGGNAVGAPQLAEWTADAAMLEKLAPETVDPLVKKYRLRPPKGCDMMMGERRTRGQGEVELACVWGDPAKKRIVLSLVVVQALSPPNDRAEVAVAGWVNAFRPGVQNFRVGNVEQGLIGGIGFARIRWNADSDKGKLHGIFYVGFDGNQTLSLYARAAEPEHEDTLRVAEAAILTWKKAE